MTDERHVLVIFPHPDDETFSSAGTIASYIEAGIPVTYACLTLGQMGRNLGNPPFATRESGNDSLVANGGVPKFLPSGPSVKQA